MPHSCWMSLILFGSLCVTAWADDTSKTSKSLTFERDIRPILKAACFQCHGDEDEKEGSLDLRLRKLIVRGGESGAAIVPGSLEKSLLFERIQSGDMPPEDDKLSKQQIQTIARWIKSGAATARPEPDNLDSNSFTDDDRNFWSLRPVRRPGVPTVRQADRVRTPVDAFLLAKLEEQGLTFSADADKTTLVRRVYFDLVGLPPTPQQIENYLADQSPAAYERLIDQLLASPRYGERWGRHWQDVAGYADSEGYTDADLVRDSAFRYRDYLIRSFNDDKSYSRFIREQLAGDEMAGPTSFKNMSPQEIEQLVATGFLRMAPDGTGSGGIDQKLARNQVIAETIKIVSTSLMGLTVGCAQCHNHRYDPILQADYYRLRAVFEPAFDTKRWRTPAARKISLYTDYDRKVAAGIEAEAKKVDDQRLKITQQFIDQTLETQLLKVAENLRQGLRAAYNTPGKDRTAEQKELLEQYPRILKISAGSLYLYDREIRTEAAQLDREHLQKQKEFVEKAFSKELAKLPEQLGQKLRAARSTPAQKRADEQKQLLKAHAGILVTAGTLAQFDQSAAEELKKLKQAAVDHRATQKADRVKAFQEKAADIRARKPVEGFVRPLTEKPGQIPETFLFHRGDHEQPKGKMLPAGLSILTSQHLGEISVNDKSRPTTGRRLAFARRLTSGKHPLTARVLVNRFWLHHFGKGLVDTPGDFGYLGARPTHPQLLDWLADEFVASGWSLKRMHRLMMTSTAYRQSSRRNPKLNAADPDNRLYGRMSIRRLEAEIIRDAILAISGKLNSKMYGKPVPVMEDDVGQIIIGQENLDGERKPGATIPLHGEEFRRSLYVQIRRSRLLGVLDTFDSATMEPNCTARNSSTVAPQALMMMNSQFAVDYAKSIADRVRSLAGDDLRKQTRLAWLLAFGSQPTDKQIEASVQFLHVQNQHYEKDRPAGVKDSPDSLALASFCQALISSNAFLYVD